MLCFFSVIMEKYSNEPGKIRAKVNYQKYELKSKDQVLDEIYGIRKSSAGDGNLQSTPVIPAGSSRTVERSGRRIENDLRG